MTGARLGSLPQVAAALAKARAELVQAQADAERAATEAEATALARSKLLLTSHGLVRVRQRIFNGIECLLPEPWQLIFQLWDDGRKEAWHDPDDPPDCVTVVSVGPRGALVGRRDFSNDRIWLVSALTLQQYDNNARQRWKRADRRYLR